MYHNSVFGGHNGVERMIKNIRKFYNWINITVDVEKYVRQCSICEKAKIIKHTKSPMIISSTATEPFQKVFVDIVGPINPKSRKGNLYILTCSCSLSKFIIGVPMTEISALSTARVLVHSVFLKYGLPEIIVTDNGTNFTAETLKEVNRLFKIKKVFTTPYRPQSNQVERFHRTLGHFMKAFVQKEHNRWCEYIDFATFSYNNSYNTSTGYSPFELIFGRICRLPTEITNKAIPTYNYESYVSELRNKLRTYYELARENVIQGKNKNKKYYDQYRDKQVLNLKKNDLVLVLIPKKNRKFDNPYEGPYRVIKEQGPVTVLVQRNDKNVKVHKDRIKLAQANFPNPPPLLP